MAMSLYLGGLGADAGGYTAEHRAAAKYYAGSKWATAGQGVRQQRPRPCRVYPEQYRLPREQLTNFT